MKFQEGFKDLLTRPEIEVAGKFFQNTLEDVVKRTPAGEAHVGILKAMNLVMVPFVFGGNFDRPLAEETIASNDGSRTLADDNNRGHRITDEGGLAFRRS